MIQVHKVKKTAAPLFYIVLLQDYLRRRKKQNHSLTQIEPGEARVFALQVCAFYPSTPL